MQLLIQPDKQSKKTRDQTPERKVDISEFILKLAMTSYKFEEEKKHQEIKGY